MGPLAETGPGSDGRLAGRYRLAEPIGSGGMGRVYRAHDEVLDRDVAVKLLDESAPGGTGLGPACAEEARAAARLAHPGIARVFDSGVQDGRCFVVMELVPGRPLAEVLHERRTLPPLEAAELAAQVADALEEAHRQGIIHCDVKPQNIIVTPEGTPKLVDFGIARAVSATSGVRPAEILGSAPYLAPEQARGERLDARTDVYALGSVLYESLSGRPPFTGHSAAEIIAQRLVGEPPSPRSLDANIPPELERVVLAALAGDPARRYRTAGDFADALRRAASHVSAAARARTVPVGSAAVLGGATLRPEVPAVRPSWPLRGRAGLAAAAAILVLGALLAAAIAVWPASRDRVSPQDAAPAPRPPTIQPTPPSTVAPQAAPTVAPALPPTGSVIEGGTGARGAGQEAERKAEEERKKADEEAKKKADEERKKPKEKGPPGGRR